MKIAINLISFNHGKNKLFVGECLKSIIEAHPKDEFFIITNNDSAVRFSSYKNVSFFIVEKELKTALAAQFWYNYKLSSLAKKNKADAIINADGVCSLRTKIPQLSIIENLSFLQQPNLISKSQLRFYKKMIPLSLNKASRIITTSSSLKNELITHFKLNEDKINVAKYAANETAHPINNTEKENIKNEYAKGNEFFLFSCSSVSDENLMML